MNNKTLAWGAGILGIIFVIIAVVYWTHTAGTLPHFMPGFVEGSSLKHFKHGLASLIVAILLFIFAWFRTGTKGRKNEPHYRMK